jgi:hypothetical protein
MAMKDGASDIKVVIALADGAHTTDVTSGTAIDTKGYEALTLYRIAGTWTDGTHTFDIEHSDATGSGWEDTTASHFTAKWPALPAISSVATAVNAKSAYVGGKRYVRVNLAISGETSGAIYGVVAVLSKPTIQPVSA